MNCTDWMALLICSSRVCKAVSLLFIAEEEGEEEEEEESLVFLSRFLRWVRDDMIDEWGVDSMVVMDAFRSIERVFRKRLLCSEESE